MSNAMPRVRSRPFGRTALGADGARMSWFRPLLVAISARYDGYRPELAGRSRGGMRVLHRTPVIDDAVDVQTPAPAAPAQGWRARPVLASLLAVFVLLVPVIVAVGVALLAGRIVERPATTGAMVVWWSGVFLLS